MPATLSVGSPFSQTSTATGTTTLSDGTTSTTTDVFDNIYTLASDTTLQITVPAGTFSCYEVDESVTDTINGTSSLDMSQNFYAPGVGLIETVDGTGSDETTEELTSFSAPAALSIVQQPSRAEVGTAIAPPIVVDINGADGMLDTTSSADVTLAIASGPAGRKLTGTTTVAASAGVATFDNVAATVDGTYTLTATSAGEASATSDPFTVSGDHFVMVSQPASTDVDSPIVFKVKALDSKDKLDSTFSDDVQASLNTITGGTDAVLDGTTEMSFVDGTATFSKTTGPTINVPGSYTVTLTAVDPTTSDADDSATAVTTKSFTVAGLHVVFSQEPVNTDINAPLVFTAEIKNAKNQLDTTAGGKLTVQLNAVGEQPDAATQRATLQGTQVVDVAAGVARFTASDDLTVNNVGEFTLSGIQETDDSGTLVPGVATEAGTSKAFTIEGLQLVITQRPPAGVDVNAPIAFKVALEDEKHKIIDDNTDYVDISSFSVVGNANVSSSAMVHTAAQLLSGGMATFGSGKSPYMDATGDFSFNLTEYSSIGLNTNTDVAVDTTKTTETTPVKVTAFHLAFLTQPPRVVTVNTPIDFRVALEDAKFDFVTATTTDEVGIESVYRNKDAADSTITWYYSPIGNGISLFGDDGFPTLITQPGRYQFVVAAYQFNGSAVGDVDPLVKTAESIVFNVVAAATGK
jgi:hypothetical protein